MLADAVAHRRHRLQVGPHVGYVLLRHAGVPAVREHRIVMAAARGPALDHGAPEVLGAPPADAGLPIRRDVGHVERAELGVHAAAASEEGTAVRMIGVAAVASAGVEHVSPPENRIRVMLRRGRNPEHGEQNQERRRYSHDSPGRVPQDARSEQRYCGQQQEPLNIVPKRQRKSRGDAGDRRGNRSGAATSLH